MDCWATLGIDETSDAREIKRAYAKLVKQNNPEDKPEEFQRIREAYDQALLIAEYLKYQQDAEGKSVVERIPLPRQLPEQEVVRHEQPVQATSRDKERTLATQVETIDAALSKLVALLRDDAAAAIDSCRATLQEDFFQALDVRYE